MGKINGIEVSPPLSRLEFLLLNWRDWMRRIKSTSRGCPGKSSGFTEAGCNSVDDHETVSDNWHAEVINTIVSDLPDAENNAIRHQYLDERYRYQIVFYSANLASGRRMIQWAMDKKGIW